MSKPELEPIDLFYPESDGKPVAESDLHRTLLLLLVDSAARHFARYPDVYVSGNMLLYYVEGHPESCVAPDVYAVRGIEKRMRRTYKVWEEGKAPDLVVEITSPSTHREDLVEKKGIYERIGVKEYFIHDPEGRRFKPHFRGYRRKEGVLEPIPPERIEGGTIVFRSEVFGLELHGGRGTLRWMDPATGELLPDPVDLERLVAEARGREGRESSRAEAEKSRAEAERARAEAEKARAERAEAELARLREELARRRP